MLEKLYGHHVVDLQVAIALKGAVYLWSASTGSIETVRPVANVHIHIAMHHILIYTAPLHLPSKPAQALDLTLTPLKCMLSQHPCSCRQPEDWPHLFRPVQCLKLHVHMQLMECPAEDDYITSVAWAADGKHVSVGTSSAQVQVNYLTEHHICCTLSRNY